MRDLLVWVGATMSLTGSVLAAFILVRLAAYDQDGDQ
jgi:hypothetical protein